MSSIDIRVFFRNFNHMPIFKLNIWPQPALSSIFYIPVKYHSPKCVWELRKEGVKSPFLHPSGTNIAGPFQPVSIFGHQYRRHVFWVTPPVHLYHYLFIPCFSPTWLCITGVCHLKTLFLKLPYQLASSSAWLGWGAHVENWRPRGGGGPGYSQPHGDPNIPGLSDFRVLLILWIGFFFTISTRQVPILFRPCSNINRLCPRFLYKHLIQASSNMPWALLNTFSMALNVPVKLVPHQRY